MIAEAAKSMPAIDLLSKKRESVLVDQPAVQLWRQSSSSRGP